MNGPLRPRTVDELVEAVASARAAGGRLSIRGGGTKVGVGADEDGAAVLDMTGIDGPVDYDPAELVLTAGAGTKLAAIERLVAAEGQMLAFEPFDHGPVFGADAGGATIGGVVAAGVAGSQRLSQGGARDHLLGFTAVSGRGERFVAGGKVVKNVTGYDLPKLAAGSWGRLFAITELTLRVLPAPRERLTLVLDGLAFAAAQHAMARALGGPASVAAAAHLPGRDGEPSRTLLRLQGFGPSVGARAAALERLLADVAPVRRADEVEAAGAWDALRTLSPLPPSAPLWRISVPPSRAPGLVTDLPGEWLADWGGGLVWLAGEVDPALFRARVVAAGGHAAFVRGPAALRRSVPTLHPQPAGVAALEARVRRAFDPDGVFETGRFDGGRA